jgi:hypothetical protein
MVVVIVVRCVWEGVYELIEVLDEWGTLIYLFNRGVSQYMGISKQDVATFSLISIYPITVMLNDAIRLKHPHFKVKSIAEVARFQIFGRLQSCTNNKQACPRASPNKTYARPALARHHATTIQADNQSSAHPP